MSRPSHHWPQVRTDVGRQIRQIIADVRREQGRPQLTSLEEHVMDARRDHDLDQQQQTGRRLPSRMQRASDRWATAATQVAAGLTAATVGTPPQKPDRSGIAPGGVSDPTLTAVAATLAHIDASAERFVHYTTPCAIDGDHGRGDGRCPGPHAVDLADHARRHLDADDLVDAVLGTPAQTAGWHRAINDLAGWHRTTAAQMVVWFRDAYAGSTNPALSETSVLEAWVVATEDLVRRLDRLAGELAQWSGRSERRCAAGCGAAAPPSGSGATCARCRQRRSRDTRGTA